PIPSSLGNLKLLQHLSLVYNQLSGPIPPDLGKLEALDHLSLGGNCLTVMNKVPAPSSTSLTLHKPFQYYQLKDSGPVPSVLGSLKLLQHLSLSYNQLTGPIPPELGNLEALVGLSLGRNRLTGRERG
ncbi:unnamed protein product, partial [Ascophyllum nodosum]